MRKALEIAPGVLFCIGLALAGQALVQALGLPLPGAAIGLIAYALWLALGRGIDWSRRGAALLVRWLGAMVVPALVGLGDHIDRLAASALPLAVLLVVTTLVTALATAGLHRLAGGRS